MGASLVVQLSRHHAPRTRGTGVVSGHGMRSHMLQLKDPSHVQPNKQINKKKETEYWERLLR